jgi:hypothetical protein
MYGLKEDEPSKDTVEHWCQLAQAAGGRWLKVAKYKLAAFYASWHNQPLPKAPFEIPDKPKFLLGGRARNFTKWIIRQPQKESFLQSVKQAKKGMPKPDHKTVQEEEIKHIEKLTGPPKPQEMASLIDSWEDVTQIEERNLPIETVLNIETAKLQLRRTVRELFSDLTFEPEDFLETFFPSTSANYINNRGLGGAAGYLLEHDSLLNGLRTPGGWLHIHTEETKGEEERRETEEQQRTVVNDIELKRNFEVLMKRMFHEAQEEPPLVEPVGLAEALKVRVITKGPPLRQTVLTPVWRILHRHLRKHPAFELIGKPVSEEYVLNRMGRLLPEGESYLSGDFEAATDNFHSWVSNTIADEISELLRFTPELSELFRDSLTGHIYITDEGPKYQTTGQLMGSITSFVVLCVGNASTARWALEVAKKKSYLLRDAPLMINGDDVGMRGPEKLYASWQRITRFHGLIESIGKTYFTPEFVDINSTSFRREETPHHIECRDKKGKLILRETWLTLTKYVNMGLILGHKRSQGITGLDDQDDPRQNLGVRASELLRLAPPEMHTVVMKQFLHHHANILKATRLPWYAPRWIGGLGLPEGPWGRMSDLDLRQARVILLNWSKRQPIQLGQAKTSWRIWREATKRLPEPSWQKVKDQHTEIYNSLAAKEAVNLLFDSNVDLETIFVKDPYHDVARAIRHNEKLWKPKPGLLPEPMTSEELRFQGRYAALPKLSAASGQARVSHFAQPKGAIGQLD